MTTDTCAQFSFGDPVPFPEPINSPGAWDAAASISPNGQELFFTSDRAGWGTYLSNRTSSTQEFGTPTMLFPELNHGSISSDGLSFFANADRHGGYGGTDLFMVDRPSVDESWGIYQNLGNTVNSSTFERYPVISADGRELYFTRTSGYDLFDADIWVARRQDEFADFDSVLKLPPNINEGSASAASLSPDGLHLFFSSDRNGGYGAIDIWMSTRADVNSPWRDPVNLGPKINSVDNEWHPWMSLDGGAMYFSRSPNADPSNADNWYASVVAEPPGQELTIVYPSAYENVEGPEGFSTVDEHPNGGRFQLVYSASDSLLTVPNSHRYLTGIRWRPDRSLSEPLSLPWTHLEARVSATSKDPTNLSWEFAENIGADETLIYNGPITLTTSNSGPAEGPREFDYVLDFETPYYYDPNAGNLLIDFTMRGPATGLPTDGCCSSAVPLLSRWVWDADPDSQYATWESDSLPIIQFVFTSGVKGDFNGDNVLDSEDIDLLTTAVVMTPTDLTFDLNDDEVVTDADVEVWVKNLRKTWVGDANVDGEFNTKDLVDVLTVGKYETGEFAVWSEGDWNADGKFGTSDFVAALIDGGYDLGERNEVAAVPEPGAWVLCLVATGLCCWRKRRWSNCDRSAAR